MNFEDIIKAINIEPYYRDWQSDIVIYNADCRDILPLIPDKSIDLVLTDPPYGINYKPDWNKWNGDAPDYEVIVGDDEPFDPEFLMNYKTIILFGANYYSNKLPIGDWIVWDKRLTEKLDKMFSNPIELIWAKSDKPKLDIIRVLSGGVINPDSINGNNEKRYHPTQKPVTLILRLLNKYSDVADIVLDPFLGSGTTAVAAKILGRKCIGIEIEEKYCEIAKKRLAQGVLL